MAPPLSARPSPTARQVWQWLSTLTDPEIPVVTLKEMGILRGVDIGATEIIVTITPTYSGCPAMSQIHDDIVR
ncbi:MAG: putative 1,2-phenylacetyl-CoA epoxidase, subunit, partial [Pseudomonadota bacterium]